MATLALSIMALASIVVAAAAVVVAVEVRGSEPQPVADSSSNAAILAALQSLAADRGTSSLPGPAPDGEPASTEGAAPLAESPPPVGESARSASGSPAPAAATPAAPTSVAQAPVVPVPTSETLTGTLYSAVDPANSLAFRQGHVERGGEAGVVLEQIGARAGAMLQVVRPRVIDPIEMDGPNASGRLQVTFAGAPGPETPLRLTFVYLDGTWKLSARSVCDVASFNGFACPSGYVR